MTDQQHDKKFAAFLAGESELAERYAELGNEEPPPELDAQILAAARAAAKVRRLKFGPRGGWLKPVALAATVLLSLSLVMNIIIDAPVSYEQVATELTSTDTRPDAETAIQELRSSPEKKRTVSNLPAAREQEMVVEEIAVVARKLRPEGVKELAPSPQSVEPDQRTAERNAALLIVAGYVAAIDSGRLEADAMEMEIMPKVERTRSALAGSATDDQFTAAGDEYQFYDDLEQVPENKPDSLLRDIERLNVSGASAEAGALLDEFLRRYPDHPVSVKIRQQDD